MSSSVKVTSLEELDDFRAAVATFVDHAGDALLAVDMETRRFVEWLRHEQPRYWHQAQQKCADELAEAKAALVRKKLRKMDDGREPDTTEEIKAIRQAKAKQEYVEEKIANTRKWGRLIDQPVNEYIGQARQLTALVEGDPAPVVRFLRGAIGHLEGYLSVEAPRTAEALGVAETESAARSVGPEVQERLAEDQNTEPTGEETAT